MTRALESSAVQPARFTNTWAFGWLGCRGRACRALHPDTAWFIICPFLVQMMLARLGARPFMDMPENKFEAERLKPRADWLAWSLQLVFGMFAGFGVGWLIARLLWDSGLIGFDQMLFVIAGVCMCAGAFTSFYGNRAWMMPSVFVPSEPPQSRTPRTCSVVIGALGVALVLLPVILRLGHFQPPARDPFSTRPNTFVLQNGQLQPAPESPRPASIGMRIFFLLFAILPGFLCVHALRTGTGFAWAESVDRDDTPLRFWLYVFLNAFVVVCVLYLIC